MQRFEIDGIAYHAVGEVSSSLSVSLIDGYLSSFPSTSSIPGITLMFDGITYEEYISLSSRAISGAKRLKGPDDINYMAIATSMNHSPVSENRYDVEISFNQVEGLVVSDKSIYIENDWEYIIDESFEDFPATVSVSYDSSGRTGGKQNGSITWYEQAGGAGRSSNYAYDDTYSIFVGNTCRFEMQVYLNDLDISGYMLTDTTTSQYATIRLCTDREVDDGYSNSIELVVDFNAQEIYISYRNGTTETKTGHSIPYTLVVDTWYHFRIVKVGLNIKVFFEGNFLFDWDARDWFNTTAGTVGGISIHANVNFMYYDLIKVKIPRRSVLALPPGSEPVGTFSNIHTLDTPYGKIYRSIGAEKQITARWEETGPDCILYADFRDRNASAPKNFAFNLDTTVASHGIDLISNGQIIENGGFSGNALRLASDMSDGGSQSVEKTKYLIFPYVWNHSSIGQSTVRVRCKYNEFPSVDGHFMNVFGHAYLTQEEEFTLQRIVELDQVQENAGGQKKYRFQVRLYSEGATYTDGTTVDLLTGVWYDWVMIWDYDNNYKMLYLNGEMIHKSYNMTATPANSAVYSYFMCRNSSDIDGIVPDGWYRNNVDVDLVAIYQTVIHPIKGHGLMPAENIRAYRIPNSSILDWWRDSANVLDQLEVGWTQTWTGKTSQYEFTSYSDFPEVANLSTGTLHGGGIWSLTDMPDLAFYNTFRLNGLDSRIHIPDRDFYKENWLGESTTFVIWFKHDSTDATDGAIFSNVMNSSGEYAVILRWLNSSNQLTVEILAGIAAGSTDIMRIYVDSKDDIWHQYIIVMNTDYVQLYRDGRFVRDQFLTWDTWNIANTRNVSDFPLGTLYPYGAPWAGDTTHAVEGQIHGFMWINKAITAAEAKLLYHTYPRKAWYIPKSYQTWMGQYNLLKENNDRFAKETNVAMMWNFRDGTPAHQLTYVHDTGSQETRLQRYYGATGQTNNTPDANGPQWVADTPSKNQDYSLYFDGSDDRLLSIDTFANVGLTADRSYAFIFKTDQATVGQVRYLFTFYQGATNYISVRLPSGAGDRAIDFIILNGTSQFYDIPTTDVIDYRDGKWHMFVLSYTHSSADMDWYIDGKFAGNVTRTQASGTITSLVYVGSFGTQANSYLDGNMAHLAVYDIALTGAEIRKMHKDWFGSVVQEERTIQRLFHARDWGWHQKKNVNVVGDPTDTLWIENGLIALRISKQSKFDAGHISQYVWDPSVNNWDYMGNIGVYAETQESTGINDQYVRNFDIVEITTNSVIIDCEMMNNWELDPITETTDTRSWNENDIIIRVELFGGHQSATYSIVSSPMYEETFSSTSFQWLIHFMEGAYYHFTVLGGVSASSDAFGRTSSSSRDEPNHAWMPAGAFIRHGRKWVGFLAGTNYSSATDRMYFATITGVARQYNLRSLNINEKFIVGAVPTSFYPLVYPRDNSEPGVTYTGAYTVEVASSLTATTTPDGYVTELDTSTGIVTIAWGTLDPGHYWMGWRIYGSAGGTTGTLRDDGTTLYSNVATSAEEVIMVDQYYDATGVLDTRFTEAGTNGEIDYAVCIPVSGQKGYQGIMDAVYLAFNKTKNAIGGRIGDKSQ
jgi:hypothetical protein